MIIIPEGMLESNDIFHTYTFILVLRYNYLLVRLNLSSQTPITC